MKLHVLHPILFFAIGILVGCSHEIELVDFATEASYDLQESQISVLFLAKADTASVTVHSNGKWSIEATNDRASSWLTYSPEGGGKGDTRVKIEVTANDEYEERSAVLHFRNGKEERTINVAQKPEKAFLVSSEKAEFGPSGGSFDVMVTSNISYTLTIVDAPWLHQVITKGVEETLSFTVDRNDRADKRQGKLVFDSELGTETVTVYQTGVSPQMILSANAVDVPSEGGRVRVDVSSNFNVEYSISADWICEITTRSLSTNSYSFYVERNPDFDGRSAEIVFRNAEKNISETVTIHQSQQDAIVLGQGTYEIDYKEQTFSMTVSANVDVQVELPEGIDWLTPVRTKGLSDRTLVFAVGENETKAIRYADIILTSDDLRQSVLLSQLPTTHLPNTREEWVNSIGMTNAIARKTADLDLTLDDSESGMESVFQLLKSIDEVIEVLEPYSESIVPIMQRDSMIINITLNHPVTTETDPVASSSQIEGWRASRSMNRVDRRSKKGKALILAPFQKDFKKPLNDWYDLLTQFYLKDNIDTLQNSHAEISLFSGENLSQYDFILIDTHGGTGAMLDLNNKRSIASSLLTSGTRYTGNEKQIDELVDNGLSKTGILVADGWPYLCMLPDLLEDYVFDKSLVILSACESAKPIDENTPNPMVERFLRNDALVVSGATISMSSFALRVYVDVLLHLMANGFSFQDAHRIAARDNHTTEWQENVLEEYDDFRSSAISVAFSNPIDTDGLNMEHIIFRPEVPQGDFFFFSPYPTLSKVSADDESVFLSWSSNLDLSFNIRWKFVDSFRLNLDSYNSKTGKYSISIDTQDVYYRYFVSYDLFVDGKPVDKSQYFSNYSASWSIDGSGEHTAYVVANIMEGDTVLASYRSNTIKFIIESIKVSTEMVESVTFKSATVSGSYQAEYSFDIQEQGIVYSSTNTEPTIIGSDCRKQVAEAIGNPFTSKLTELESLTKYYARAYMIVGKDEMCQIYYGNVIDFTTDPIKNVIPDDILDKLDDHITIYGGVNPPNIEGQYVISPNELYFDSTGDFSPGHVFDDCYIQFLNQDMDNNSLDYREEEGISSSTGLGAFISGEGDAFTVFFNTVGVYEYSDYSISFKAALIISGIKTENGIKDLNEVAVLVEKSDDPKPHLIPAGSYRAQKDGDGLSVPVNYFNSPSMAPRKGFLYPTSYQGIFESGAR